MLLWRTVDNSTVIHSLSTVLYTPLSTTKLSGNVYFLSKSVEFLRVFGYNEGEKRDLSTYTQPLLLITTTKIKLF